MRKFFVFFVVAALVAAMSAGVAEAKGKPAGKGKPAQKKVAVVGYVFEGEVLSVDADSVLVAVENGNKFAQPLFGTQLDVAAGAATKVVEDDVKSTLSDLDAGDAVVVKAKAPRGAQSFTANVVVGTSPTAPYYFDADGDGIGAGEAPVVTEPTI